jgi:hypothetical protein
VISAVSNDISRSGFSFTYCQYVPEGAIVEVVFNDLPRCPQLCGVVRNCVHLGGRNHRIGVEFTKRA